MRIPHAKFILLMIFILVFLSFFSCAKDSDLLADSVLSKTESASIEERTLASESGNEIEVDPNNDWITKTFVFTPISDAYIQEEEGYDQSIIRLQEDYRTSYLLFDLSAIQGNITGVVLQFTINSDDGNGTIDVSKGVSSDWIEEDLTENNAPSKDISLGTVNKVYEMGATEKIPLNASDILPEKTTIVLTHTSGNDLAFASKEHPDGIGPKLIVTYKVPPGTPDLEPVAQEIIETPTPVETPAPIETPEPEQPTQQNPVNQYPNPDYYVTTNGKATNDGKSEASAWSIEYAFNMAVAGDVVYIKSGNYGNKQLRADNPGTPSNTIRFIGYTNTPGDLISNDGSTFEYGNVLDPNKMPYINGNGSTENTGLRIDEDNVSIENFQITRYRIAVNLTGKNVGLKNIIVTELGSQSNYDAYDGFGFQIKGDNAIIENCFALNAAAEAYRIYGSNNSIISYCSAYGDNPSNPTDYYFFLAGGTNNTLVENCYAERERSLGHGGHGFDMKDLAENNTFRNCTARRTNIELNFSGVRNNIIEDCFIYGVDTTSNNWHATLLIKNGANNNLIKNVYIQDTYRAIYWGDSDDGYVGPGGDRDEIATGSDNTFEGIIVKNTGSILQVGSGGDKFNAWARRNTFIDCDFSNFGVVANTYYPTEDITFQNCSFDQGNNLVTEAQGAYQAYSDFDVTWENCTWTNVNFPPPN